VDPTRFEAPLRTPNDGSAPAAEGAESAYVTWSDPQSTALEVFHLNSQAIETYAGILRGRAIEWGLLGPREADRVWDRHILNSAALSELIPDRSTVVDVGSGAGLPGVPLAILRPDLTVSLLEPLLRRSTFLIDVVAELGLGPRVRVVRERAEDHEGRYDVVVARAVAPLDGLIRWCDPLRRPGGMLLALKGDSAEADMAQAAKALQARGLQAEVVLARAHPEAEPARVVRVTPSPADPVHRQRG
jgi:16S rRNA (guanine527-N7)-methyltransferase